MLKQKEFKMEDFKSWEDMSKLEQAQCIYWDMHKDAYGVRPRGIDTSAWTIEQFEEEFEFLQKAINANYEQEKEQQTKAIKKFEQHVINTMCMGAGDRETALRWIMDASNANGDWEYLCYDLGLPYRYFSVDAVAV
jgi:hypothetical protein